MTDTQQIFSAMGGIGMFLLGMELLTRALRDAAGSRLRGWLARFTTTPLRGVVTGALVTSVIQSSSATTVMTVGFVGAGLLDLGQALGILYGANIGTTITGWLVTFFGLKLDLAAIAMAVLLPAALAMLLTRGTGARIGRAMAGLALMLIGLEIMQDAMQGAAGMVLPQGLTSSSLIGLIKLAATGLAVTVLIQSSSAAVALTLVMLQGGLIGLPEAAAMVVGMNVGTTFTALMASIGGSRQMRQTAIANLLFNVVTGALALPVVLFAPDLLAGVADRAGPMTALMAFHTGFNLAGTALFLPFTRPFAALVRRLVPEGRGTLVLNLDRAMLDDPASALMASLVAARTIRRRIFSALARALATPPDLRGLSTLEPTVPAALDKLESYATAINLSAATARQRQAFSALLHEIDHLRRLMTRSQQRARIAALLDCPGLRRPVCLLGAILQTDPDGVRPRLLENFENDLNHRVRRLRHALLQSRPDPQLSPQDIYQRTDAMRWLQRALHHVHRSLSYEAVLQADLAGRNRETAARTA